MFDYQVNFEMNHIESILKTRISCHCSDDSKLIPKASPKCSSAERAAGKSEIKIL